MDLSMNWSTKMRLDAFAKKILEQQYVWNKDSVNRTCKEVTYPSGVTRHVDNIIDEAVENKRSGNYSESVGLYLDVLECTAKMSNQVPAFVARSMCKTLIAANEYLLAFLILNDAFHNIVDCWGAFDNFGRQIIVFISNDLLNVFDDCMMTVLHGDLTKLYNITADYSGNSKAYKFIKTNEEIINEFYMINQYENYAKRRT